MIKTFEKGEEIREKVVGYEYALPEMTGETGIALALILAGIAAIALVETAAAKMK